MQKGQVAFCQCKETCVSWWIGILVTEEIWLIFGWVIVQLLRAPTISTALADDLEQCVQPQSCEGGKNHDASQR